MEIRKFAVCEGNRKYNGLTDLGNGQKCIATQVADSPFGHSEVLRGI